MIQPSSLPARALLVAASVAAHAAVFLAAPHPRPTAADRAAPVEFDLDVLPQGEPPAARPSSPAGRGAPIARARSEPAPRVREAAARAVRALAAQPSPEAAPIAAAGDAPPSFTIAMAPVAYGVAGLSAASEPYDAPALDHGGASPARLARGGAPPYPRRARDAGVEADVPLEIVVSAEGTVDEARALSHPGYGLEAAAIDAVRTYRFTPATKDRRPVRVRMRWTVQFRLW